MSVPKLRCQTLRLLCEIADEAQRAGDGTSVMRHDPSRGIDRKGHDLVGRIMRDLFDVHPTFGRDNKGHARCLAIDQHREIEFLLDVAAVLDIQAVDLLTCRTGLRGDKRVAEHFPGVCGHFVDGFGKPHTSFRIGRQFFEFAFAAAARMDLGFHDVHGARKGFRHGHCFIDRERWLPFGNWCAEIL
jgi:hypothetical protein